MSKRKGGLGRGLGDLGLTTLLQDTQSVVTDVAQGQEARGGVEYLSQQKTARPAGVAHIAVDLIRPGQYQPRRHFCDNALDELAASIKAQGVIQPLVLRRMNDGYEIIAGERRWRAAQRAEMHAVPAIVRDVSDQAAMAMALIENIQRKDLNAIEEATALHRLIDECHLTHQAAAEAVGKSRTVVTNLLRLLKLHPEVKKLLEQNRLEMGHARALLALEPTEQLAAAKQVVQRGLSARQTEALVKGYGAISQTTTHKTQPDPDIVSLQDRLSRQLGATVKLQHQTAGNGKLVVYYHSVDELEGIIRKF